MSELNKTTRPFAHLFRRLLWPAALFFIVYATIHAIFNSSQPNLTATQDTQILHPSHHSTPKDRSLSLLTVQNNQPKPVQNEAGAIGFEKQLISRRPNLPNYVRVPQFDASQTGFDNTGIEENSWALIDDLYNWSLELNQFSQSDAEFLTQQLSQLARQGSAALPAIHEFLMSGQNVIYRDLQGGNEAPYPTLRAGLIHILGNIGGPSAIENLVKTIASSAEPYDIAAIGKELKKLTPGGAYRKDLLAALSESLGLVTKTIDENLTTPNTKNTLQNAGPLFEVIRTLGDSDLLSQLLQDTDQTKKSWKINVMIALGMMPNGEGLPILRNVLMENTYSLDPPNLFGMQILTASASTSTQAADILLEVASSRGQDIPPSDWRNIAETLRGYSYDFGIKPVLFGIARPNVATWSQAQIERQISLIDQLQALDLPSEAADELDQTRQWILDRTKSP